MLDWWILGALIVAVPILAIRIFRAEARSRWPAPLRYVVRAAKWYFIAGGIIGVGGLAIEEHQQGRVVLGTGFIVAALAAAIEGSRRYLKQRRTT